MGIDLKRLTPVQLADLIERASSQIILARSNLIEDTRGKIDAILSTAGLSLGEVYPTRSTRGPRAATAKRAAIAPKYRNPEDSTQLWSGRGRQPYWVADALRKRGVSIEDLLIDKTGRARANAQAAKKHLRTPGRNKRRNHK